MKNEAPENRKASSLWHQKNDPLSYLQSPRLTYYLCVCGYNPVQHTKDFEHVAKKQTSTQIPDRPHWAVHTWKGSPGHCKAMRKEV